MKTIVLTFGSFLLAIGCQAQLNGRCDIYGVIYLTEIPQEAHYRVYLEDSEAFANAVIFEEENELMADRPGLWYFTDNRRFARFVVFITDDKSNSDFTIYYTDIPDYARCN